MCMPTSAATRCRTTRSRRSCHRAARCTRAGQHHLHPRGRRGSGPCTGWYGDTGGGDPASASGAPLVWEFTGSNTATGGTGSTEDIADTVTDYSAYRHANWSFIALDVTDNPVVMDSVTLVRRSRADNFGFDRKR
jgi:hypothetical protein